MSNTHQSTTGNNQLELWNVLSQLMEDNAPSWQLFQWCLPDSLLHRLALVMVQEIFTAEEAAQRPPRLEWYRSLLTKQRWLKQEASDPHLSSAWYKARHSFSRLEAKGLPPIQRIVWKVARSAGDRNGRRSAIVVSELWIQYRLLQNETTNQRLLEPRYTFPTMESNTLGPCFSSPDDGQKPCHRLRSLLVHGR